MLSTFIIKADVPASDSIPQYPSFNDYFASLLLVLLSCILVMPQLKRRSQANVTPDDIKGSLFDPLLSLQSTGNMNMAILRTDTNNLSGAS
jgi:hypothetical protein